MALDDFSDEDSDSKDGNNEGTAIDEPSPKSMLRAVDYHIISAAEHLDLETNTIPQDPTLHVAGDVIIADRTRLAAVIAVAISNMGDERVKDLEDLTAVEIQG